MADTPAPTIVANQASNSTPPPEDFSGRTLGDFELIRRIGMGGMGQVYLARQKSLKRQVAIKILKAELAANTTALLRFRAEAEAVANITHANIVQVYAIGETDGLHYMALEYVDGRNLRDFLEKKGVPDLPFALNAMHQVASALERAGELGFVHRDIKPENILLSKKGEVKVTDFGLSRAFGTEAPLNLTQSGVTMGTPLYMAPEQVRGQPVDPRTDIYSFGVTCYHLLAGEPPFRGATAFDVALQHVQAEPRPLQSIRPDLPADLCAVVHKMMAKMPEARYQSAREIITDLTRFREGMGLTFANMPLPLTGSQMTPNLPPPASSGRGRRWALVGLLAVIAAVGGAALHWAQAPTPPTPDPDAALNDIDPAPDAIREKELKKQIADKTVKVEFAADALLELAMLYIKDRRHDEALKLFDGELSKKYAAFDVPAKDPGRVRNMTHILAGLGRALVLSYQDRAEESNDELLKVLRDNPATIRPGKVDLPKLPPLPNRGQLETFFGLSQAGMHWKKAIGDAIDRNAKNQPGKPIPNEFIRLRALPLKGPLPKG